MEQSRRRKVEAPNSTDEEWVALILAELKVLNKQYDDPNDNVCKHCINISICERYDELHIVGYLPGEPRAPLISYELFKKDE